MQIYYPETIENAVLNNIPEMTSSSSTGYGNESNISVSEKATTDVTYPNTSISYDTINATLNTKTSKILGTYTFGQVGSLQIGSYENGVSGELKISPNGITAKNINGVTTFALDGTTGDATFKGTIQAGAVISGAIDVGTGNVQIDGANKRIIINDGTNDIILIGYQSGGF